MSIQQNLEQRIAELEMKSAFQETAIEELNQSLIEQQFLIDKMQVQLRYLVNKLKEYATFQHRQPSRRKPHHRITNQKSAVRKYLGF